MMKVFLFCAFFGSVAATASAVVTLAPLATFGGGDGWLAPADNAGDSVTAGTTERGLAYNPVTGHLLMTSRASGNQVRILDSATGADLGGLTVPAGTVTGGTFAINQVRVAGDGAIYVANLASPLNTTVPFKIYRWANEAAATNPTVAFNLLPAAAGARVGDNFNIRGSGVNTRFVAGESTATGSAGAQNGYMIFTTTDGANFTSSTITFGTPPAVGDFNRGTAFLGSDTAVVGKGSPGTARVTSFSGSTGSLGGSPSIAGFMMDYATVGGVPLLATLDISSAAGTNTVRVYDMTDPLNPSLEATMNLTTSFTSSAGSVGSVTWGEINGNTANLYALNVSNGIQAFTVTVPEPASGMLAFLGLLALARHRRRR
ncbi:MAG TPA: PEP-CTERM sorting domain-containing protein [Verrucomicrobiales bacterium]|nr:PEP-CTERM sorting domain-containing protein [Verrucomicrobiales bacterium]